MEKEVVMELIKMLISNEKKEGAISPESHKKYLIGEYVIVRCKDAGVHAGILVDYNGREVIVKESRRLWYFKCKSGHSLSGVALHGITNDSKITGIIKKELILNDACEIIPTTTNSERSIRDAEEHDTK